MTHRTCPLCQGEKYAGIHLQKFAGKSFHAIVRCAQCEFVYVRNTPSEKEYESHYGDESIYEVTRDEDIHHEAYLFLKDEISKQASILDIGCSTGNLLAEFKKYGYQHLIGIDPSPACRTIAKNKFGVDVKTATLKSFQPKQLFGLVILNNVLEHLRDVQGSIRHIERLLVDRGFLYIALPDAGRFYGNTEEPFYEFSTEHINFFDEDHLRYLMIRFTPIKITSNGKVLFSLWQKSSVLNESMTEYIKKSKKQESVIRRFIRALPKRYLVWGAGSLTRRLLVSAKLKPYKIIDNNPKLINTSIAGVAVISSEEIRNYGHPIVVGSYRFEKEIKHEIKEKFRNKIIQLPR